MYNVSYVHLSVQHVRQKHNDINRKHLSKNAIHNLGQCVAIFSTCFNELVIQRVSINKQIVSFQNCFSVLSRLCHVKASNVLFQMCPRGTPRRGHHYIAGNSAFWQHCVPGNTASRATLRPWQHYVADNITLYFNTNLKMFIPMAFHNAVGRTVTEQLLIELKSYVTAFCLQLFGF